MIVALLALVVASAGTGYAASKLAKNSVGTKQIKKNAVVSSKVKDGSLLAQDFAAGSLPKGPKGDTGPRGLQGPKGNAGRSALTPLAAGETIKGAVGLDSDASGAGQDFAGTVSYPIPASTGPTNIFIKGVNDGGDCTGIPSNPTALPGTVCIYPSSSSTGDTFTAQTLGSSKLGFEVVGLSGAAGDIYFEGTWAFTQG